MMKPRTSLPVPGSVMLSTSMQYSSFVGKVLTHISSEPSSARRSKPEKSQWKRYPLCLSVRGLYRVNSFVRIGSADIAEGEAKIRQILRVALNCSCEILAICHCHPSGKVDPSDEDVMFTLQLRRACDTLMIKLEDHIIIGADSHASVFEIMKKHRQSFPPLTEI